MRRRLRWESEAPRVPKRPYRDSAVVYAVLSAVIVLVSWATGGSVGRALVVAALFYVIATLWSWSRFRTRLREEARKHERGASKLP